MAKIIFFLKTSLTHLPLPCRPQLRKIIVKRLKIFNFMVENTMAICCD